MKSAKKLLLLVLSLVLLIGVFAVTALAEETEAEPKLAFTYQVGNGEVQSVTSLGSPEADGEQFHTILNNLSNVKIKMYSDITLTKGVLFGTYKANPDDKTANGSKPMLDGSGYVDWDLNGHTVTVTAEATPIPLVLHNDGNDPLKQVLHFIGQYTFKLYSSVEGGKYINNSSYPIFGTHKTGGYRATYVLGTNDPTVDGGDNLTVISKGSISVAYESGGDTPLKINGGTYIYTGSDSAFATAATCTVNNATVITTGAAQSIFTNHYWVAANFTAKNLTAVASNAATKLICSGGLVPDDKNALHAAHKVTLENLVLVGEGLIPQYNVNTAGKLTFSVSGNVLTNAQSVFDAVYPETPENKVLAFAGVSANGETILVKGYINASEVVTVTNTVTGTTEQWLTGDGYSFIADDATDYSIQKSDDVWYYYSNPTWAATLNGSTVALDAICNTANAGKTVTLAISGDKAPLAFTYQVDGEEMQYVLSDGSPEADGASFYTHLNDKSNVTIKMYSDIVLTKGVLFGTLKDGQTGSGVKIQVLDQTGNVDWDLNGCTVTMAEGATPIKVGIADSGDHRFNVLHWIGKYTFKLYSTVPGGEYINKTAYSIFGAEKYDSRAPSYLVGTNDPAVCGGENLTVTTKGALIEGYESFCAYASPLKAYLTINGGKYIYEGSKTFTMIGDTNVVKNATFITTGAATAIFSNMYYKTANLTLENITVFAANDATLLAMAGNKGAPKTSVNANHKVTLNGAVLLGKGLKPAYNVVSDKVTYTVSGNIIASDKSVLDIAYPTAPEGKILANVGIVVNGETVLAMGYADASEVVTVTNTATGKTEQWLTGKGYVFIAGTASAYVTQIGDDWYYYPNPTYSASLGESAIEMDAICNSANAGATVTLSIAGEKFILAFTYQVNDGDVNYVLSEGTPEEDGDQFHTILNHLTNVKIVMYSDIVLTKGVLFGTMNEPDANGKVVMLKESGNVDWDLNGCTVTVTEDAVPLTVQMNGNDNYFSFKALHYIGTYTFKLYSSVAGGEYINNSSHAICGVCKYSSESPSYLFGTNNAAVCGGDNLTVNTKGSLVKAYESSNTSGTPLKAYVYINGGRYIYNGNGALAIISGGNKISNATFVTTDAAKAVFVNNYYRACTIDVDNLVVLAKNESTMFIASGSIDGVGMTTHTVAHKITVGDVTLIGDGLALAYNVTNKLHTYTVNGNVIASSKTVLNTAYPTAPAGKVLAYAGISLYGTDAVVMSYVAEGETVAVTNTATGETNHWLVGENYFYIATDPSNTAMVKENGRWYYYTDPVWSATLGDTAIALDAICDAANAGKTVALAVTGEREILYYTVTVDGEITYYCGEDAQTGFKALLTPDAVKTYNVKFYNDFTIKTGENTLQIGVKGGHAATYKFDLNGYKWTVENTYLYAINAKSVHVYIYSTAPGGTLDVSSASGVFMVDDGGYFYLGEPTSLCTSYGKNLTVLCKTVTAADLWSNGYAIYGGTFVQVEGASAKYFFSPQRTAPTAFRNATFIMQNVEYFTHGMRLGTLGYNYFDIITNCTFISLGGKTQLFEPIGTPGFNIGSVEKPSYTKDKKTRFTYCNFYNIINNTYEGITIEYQECKFSVSSPDAQANGFIAYTGDAVTVNIGGKDYVFGAQLITDAALVDWGFGITEYWKIGATATHKNTVVNGVFGYTFGSVTVAADGNKVTPTLAAIKPGALQMNLSLQSKIGVNLLLAGALKNAAVTFGGKTYTLAELEIGESGCYEIGTEVAPNHAHEAIDVTIVLGKNTHVVSVGVEAYAEKILGSATYANAHNLTYAMIEYVREMIPADASFCANITEAPAGYEAQTLTSTESENKKDGLLSSIAFQLDGTIAIAIQSAKDGENFVAEGKTVTLELGNGRKVTATVENGTVIFEELYVNEFYGDLKIAVEGDDYTYNYSLANYLYGIGGNSAAVQALYNYAYYADAYVQAQ